MGVEAMKIRIVTHEYKAVTRDLEVTRSVVIPSWVHPNACEWCKYDIDEPYKTVAEIDGMCYHYHNECFSKCKMPG